MGAPIRLFILTTSPTMRTLLASALGADGDVTVEYAGILGEAVVGPTKPHLPKKQPDGSEANPRSQLFLFDFELSDTVARDRALALFRGTGVPALLFVPKLQREDEERLRRFGFSAVRSRPEIRSLTTAIGRRPVIDLIRALTGLETQTRRPSSPSDTSSQTGNRTEPTNTHPSPRLSPGTVYTGPIVVVGASTGGPQSVRQVIEDLPDPFSVPVLIVQHISEGFVEGFVRWLRDTTHRDCEEAKHGTPLKPGSYLVAPSGRHMTVRRGYVELIDGPKRQYQRPSADILFETAAESYGSAVVAVLLTGMGRDGADGCIAVQESGGITVVQDEQTSVVYGMPRAAIEADAADFIVPLQSIGERVTRIVDTIRRKTS